MDAEAELTAVKTMPIRQAEQSLMQKKGRNDNIAVNETKAEQKKPQKELRPSQNQKQTQRQKKSRNNKSKTGNILCNDRE